MTRQKTILVVDDDSDILFALTGLLTEAGYAVRAHSDAETAFDELRGYLPNLVICDRNMPGMGGARFIDAMKSQALYAHIPILVISGVQPTDVGWVIYVEKPFGMVTLLDLVEKFAR